MGGALQAQSMGVVCVNNVMKGGKSCAFDISKSLTYDAFVLLESVPNMLPIFAAIFVDPVHNAPEYPFFPRLEESSDFR